MVTGIGERALRQWDSVVSTMHGGFVPARNKLAGTGARPTAFSVSLSVDGIGHCRRTRRQSDPDLPTQHIARRDVRLTITANSDDTAGFRPGSASDHEPIAASDDRAAVQPNPNSERGNAALCVVRGERRPAKWNCVVTKCGGVVGNANPERYCHLHCDGNKLDCHWCANGDRKIRSDCRIAGVNDPLARQ